MGSDNNKIVDNVWDNNQFGIWLVSSYYNIIRNNSLSNNRAGLWEEPVVALGEEHANYLIENYHISRPTESGNNSISGNRILSNNQYGIFLNTAVSNNSICTNDISHNSYGIGMSNTSSNKIYFNNFVNNTYQVDILLEPPNNTWDAGYPSGGNYWSDYTGVDLYSDPYQNKTGSDGIGDTPYVIIDENNTDRYPLMKPYGGPYGFIMLNLPDEQNNDFQGLAWDGKHLWLSNGGTAGNQTSRIYKIDPKNFSMIAEYTPPTLAQTGLAFDIQGSLWSNGVFSPNNIVPPWDDPESYDAIYKHRMDENLTVVEKYSVGETQKNGINSLAFDDEGNLWVACVGPKEIYKLKLEPGVPSSVVEGAYVTEVLERYPSPDIRPKGLEWVTYSDGRKELWVGTAYWEGIHDPSQAHTGFYDRLYVLDPEKNFNVKAVFVSGRPYGFGNFGLAWDKENEILWTASGGGPGNPGNFYKHSKDSNCYLPGLTNGLLVLSKTVLTYGEEVLVSGFSSLMLQGVNVSILVSEDGMNFEKLAEVVTNATGGYSYSWTPPIGTYHIKPLWGENAGYHDP